MVDLRSDKDYLAHLSGVEVPTSCNKACPGCGGHDFEIKLCLGRENLRNAGRYFAVVRLAWLIYRAHILLLSLSQCLKKDCAHGPDSNHVAHWLTSALSTRDTSVLGSSHESTADVA